MHTRSNNMILQRAALSFFTFFVPAITLSADVRVLSWNVYMLPSPIKNSLQHSRDIAIPELLKDSDYDIMFFQEAFTYKFRQSMIKRLSDKYPHNYYLKGSKFISAFGSGVFVMSKHPFTVLDKITYKACSGADCYANKGTAIVELELPSGKMVHFAPTHLNASRDKAEVRNQQLKQVRELFARTAKRGVPQVFLGDLNIAAGHPEFHESLETLNMAATPLIGEHQTTSGRVNECFKTTKNSHWLDHMWVNADKFNVNSTIEVIPTEFEAKGKTCPLSDHHAIAGYLTFND